MSDIHVGDVGTQIRLTLSDAGTVVDLSTCTTMQIRFAPPGGVAEIVKTAVHVTDGTDGQVEYVAEDGVLDTPGVWRCRARVVFPGTPPPEFSSSAVSFEVGAVFA